MAPQLRIPVFLPAYFAAHNIQPNKISYFYNKEYKPYNFFVYIYSFILIYVPRNVYLHFVYINIVQIKYPASIGLTCHRTMTMMAWYFYVFRLTASVHQFIVGDWRCRCRYCLRLIFQTWMLSTTYSMCVDGTYRVSCTI